MNKTGIVLIEDHCQALGCWRRMQFKRLALVHLDAHIDFAFFRVKPAKQVFGEARSLDELKRKLADTLLFEKFGKAAEEQLNIGNYIYPAMRDGIVQSFYWIVPGEKYPVSAQEKLRKYLERIKKHDPLKSKGIGSSRHNLLTNLYNKKFMAGTLNHSPKIKEPLLLDIDVDYLLFNTANDTSLTKDLGKRKPWIYPKELALILRSKFPKPKFITIAYSVNGGYTPIEFKFFGDEIYLRLKCKRLSHGLETVLLLRNKGVGYYFKADYRRASIFFRDAVMKSGYLAGIEKGFKERLSGHLYFWAFKCEWEKGDKQSARQFYNLAIKNDKSLKAEDNNLGRFYMQKKNFNSAHDEFKKILFCDAEDKYALCGMAEILLRRKRYKEAMAKYKQALRVDRKEKKALLGLAALYVKSGENAQGKSIIARLKQIEPLNPQAALLSAQIDEKQGNLSKAVVVYKKAFLLGAGGLQAFVSVFRILRKIGDKGDMFAFFRQRYSNYRSNFFEKQCRFLLKNKFFPQIKEEERLIKKIDLILEK